MKMLKKTLLIAGIITMTGCNEQDNNTNHSNTTIIIAHRGASALRPEHTLAAYQKAMDDDADFIEPDLVSTRDGVLVARHENAIDSTTNVAVLPQFAQRKTTKVIDGLNITSWFTEDFSFSELQQLKARERIPDLRPNNVQYNDQEMIPSLEQIIELAEKHYKKTGKVIGLYIETKHPSYFQNIGLALEDPLLTTLSKYKYTREIAPIYLQSFEVNNLKYIRNQLKLHKSLKNVQLIQLFAEKDSQPMDLLLSGYTTRYADMATKMGLKNVARYADGVGPSKDYIVEYKPNAITTNFVHNAHIAGLKVHPYTFRPENKFLAKQFQCRGDDKQRCETGLKQELNLFFKAGVDGVFIDDPMVGRQALNEYQKSHPHTQHTINNEKEEAHSLASQPIS